MNKLREAAIAVIAKKATEANLDDIVRQINELPPRPEGAEPLKSLFSYIEATEGSKAASESDRSDFNPNVAVDWNNNNCKVSKYFTVGEVTNYDPRRIPETPDILKKVYKMADELDKVREAWGKPIGVTSWYRPPAINAAVGGAQFSQHLSGGAVDIYPMDGSIYDFEDWLDKNWGGGLGYGSPRGFVHIDLREGGWKRGSGFIRWHY